MRKIILILTMLPLLIQCKDDPPFDDLGGVGTLKGIAIIYDTLHGTIVPSPGKKLNIYLKKKDAASYIYSVTSNDLGLYSFSGTDAAQAYTIYATVDTGTVKYEGHIDYAANSTTAGTTDTLKIYPDSTKINALHLVIQDAQGGRIPNVTAWVFNSPVLFNADTSAGRVYDMTTNSFGVSNKFNIAEGTYYLRVKTAIGNLNLTGEQRVDMPVTGIRTAIIALQNGSLNRNGIELQLTDDYNTPVNAAQVYFYRSQSIFLADTIDYKYSLFTTTSNAAGFAAAYLLEPATYYIRAIKHVNSDILMDEGSVVVGTTIQSLPMKLK